jgi:hypothetical protein
MQSIGTRGYSRNRQERVDQGQMTRTLDRDPDAMKLMEDITVSFVAASAQIQSTAGIFDFAFVAGDDLLVEGANLNNGYFHVIAVGEPSFSYLLVDPPPKDEGPLMVTLRTP